MSSGLKCGNGRRRPATLGGNIKKANKAFADELNAVGKEFKERITLQAYEEAIRLFEATNSAGLAGEVIAILTS